MIEIGTDEFVAGSQEEYQQEYAPCHSKSRERCAEVVALGGAPDFFE